MQMKLTGDTKLILGIVAAMLLLLGAAAYFGEEEDQFDGPLSTYASRSGGAKATFLLIETLGYRVQRWAQPPSSLPADAEGKLFILAEPERRPNPAEHKAIDAFVQRGGTLLVTGAYEMAQPGALSYQMPTKSWKPFPAMVPHPLNRGNAVITMPAGMTWRPGPNDLPLYGKDDAAVAVTMRRGKGQVIWLASHVPLTNAGLKAPGNVDFLANILAAAGKREVLWDTFFSEHPAGPRSAFATPAVLVAGAQLLFIFLLVFWTHGLRFGPTHVPPDATAPMSQMEFVQTLGSLYESAKATNVALEIAYGRFVFLAGRRLGVPTAEASAERLGAAVALAVGEPAKPIVDLLLKCERGRRQFDLPRAEAAASMNALRDYLQKLKLVPNQSEENS